MKLTALALAFLGSCSHPAAPAGAPRVSYTVQFASGTDEDTLQRVIEAYRARLKGHAKDAEFVAHADAITITVVARVDSAFHSLEHSWRLAGEMSEDAQEFELAGGPEPRRPALAKIDDEWLRFEPPEFERGLFGSPAVAHAEGAKAEIFSDALVRIALGTHGELEFLQAAGPEQLTALGTTIEQETERFQSWLADHADALLQEFDARTREEGGPSAGCLWRRQRTRADPVLLLRSPKPRFRFGNADLDEVGLAQDSMGKPAISFKLKAARVRDFRDYTEEIRGTGLAIVIDDEILTVATVVSRLPGSGIIEGGEGGFSKFEVMALVALLRLPPLPRQPLSLSLEFLP